jgi:hypothetical protein
MDADVGCKGDNAEQVNELQMLKDKPEAPVWRAIPFVVN